MVEVKEFREVMEVKAKCCFMFYQEVKNIRKVCQQSRFIMVMALTSITSLNSLTPQSTYISHSYVS